jgi:CHASE2 domain-containing sensor protein
MKLKVLLLSRIRSALAAFSNWLAHYWKRKFYLYLAAAFTVFALLDLAVFHVTTDARTQAFDLMVQYRIAPAKPDKDIVIVDIDEASLAAMSKESGRWPWPREVLGKFVEQVEKQHPKAVVFDILFSDPDILNPASDSYFDGVIADTNNTYFPMMRLDPSKDGESEIRVTEIASAMPIPGEDLLPDAKLNVILPYFQAVRKSGRFGTQNVAADSDGVVRSYPVYLDEYGWKLPSLPSRMAQDFGWKEPVTQQMLLNWRGVPKSFQYVSFSDIYLDLTSAQPHRAPDEFKDKIIVIGSTASNLFNLHATPMDQAHPGVEVLATAIDNYKNADSLRFPEARIWYLLITLVVVWLTAWGFYRGIEGEKIDKMFGLSQAVLVAFSFASINFGNTYVNLAGPLMLGIAYFTAARIYATATAKALESNMVRMSAASEESHATLMLIRFDSKLNVLPDAMLDSICEELSRIGDIETSVEVVTGRQKGLWGLLEKTIAISWIAPASDELGQAAIQADVAKILAHLQPVLKHFVLHVEGAASHVVHHGAVYGGARAEAGWRRIFAQAMLKWEEE